MKPVMFYILYGVKKSVLKIAYLDCSSGISGDMCLGAIVDAGVQIEMIRKGLKRLAVKGYRIEARRVKREGIAATKVDVIIEKSGSRNKKSGARTWKDISGIINGSSLPAHIRQKGLTIFKSLFEAEGRVHGTAAGRTHLHELGALDCIVDVFGTLIGLDILGVERVYSSAINLGSGFVEVKHGRLQVPAPATSEILRGFPVYSSDVPYELTTPTGAVLVREATVSQITLPLMRIERIGYGAGQKDITGSPNTLRIFVGQDIHFAGPKDLPKVTIIETNIDDMNPQAYEYVMELLFKAGALDVYLVPVIMKKGRPGIVLTILCEEDKRASITDIVFRETTTIGLRFYEASRAVLDREVIEAVTEFGRLKMKVSRKSDGTVKFLPEYEDCKRVARKYGVPLAEVMRLSAKGLKIKRI